MKDEKLTLDSNTLDLAAFMTMFHYCQDRRLEEEVSYPPTLTPSTPDLADALRRFPSGRYEARPGLLAWSLLPPGRHREHRARPKGLSSSHGNPGRAFTS